MWNSYDWGSEFEIAYLTLLLKGRSQSQKLTWNWLQIVWVYQGNNIIKFGWEGISLKKLCHFLSCTVSFFRQYIYLVQLESVNFDISIKLRIAKQGSNLEYISVGGTSPENDFEVLVIIKHITVVSLWTRWRLKSPAHHCLINRLFRRRSKKTSKRHWPLWGGFTTDRGIPRTKGQ